MPKQVSIKVFVDGEETHFLDVIEKIWKQHWDHNYQSIGGLSFKQPVNVKEKTGFDTLPTEVKGAFQIRNPDVFFIAEIGGKEVPLGGIEITVHSPDGSNVEKRYPFIWSGRKHGFTAFVVSPYMKSRPGGEINKLPNRHSVRNIDFLNEWKNKGSPTAPLYQIIPIKELQEDYDLAKNFLKQDLLSWTELSEYFCDLLAATLHKKTAEKKISIFADKLMCLATACKNVTRFTKPSSFIEIDDRWIQVYNTRPDSGHWERGEGQFDSIDGRLMFTLDEAELKSLDKKLEFWMPQLSRKHPWIAEQIERDHGSKRLRNIVKVLSKDITIKFADDLSPGDLKILEKYPGLTLERLDWKSGIYNITTLLAKEPADKVAKAGLKSPSEQTVAGILAVLDNKSNHLSTHRLYEAGWLADLEVGARRLPKNSVVLAPRIPKTQVKRACNFGGSTVVFAEECTKYQLMASRQLHRHNFK